MNYALYVLHCLTPLHNGAGDGLGAIDRPIIREVTTEYPYIQSSSIKGALRAHAEDLEPEDLGLKDENDKEEKKKRLIEKAFGARAHADRGQQGVFVISDAQILFFPVRSLAGTMAWTTAHLPLARLHRLLELSGSWGSGNAPLKSLLSNTHSVATARDQALACAKDPETDSEARDWDDAIRIPDTELYGLERRAFSPWNEGRDRLAEFAKHFSNQVFDDEAWREFFKRRLVVLPDEPFSHFVQTATCVEPNIRILPTGVTDEGSLRYTEFLPAESMLSFSIWIDPPVTNGSGRSEKDFEELRNLRDRLLGASGHAAVLQFGADESKGKGLVRVAPLHGNDPAAGHVGRSPGTAEASLDGEADR